MDSFYHLSVSMLKFLQQHYLWAGPFVILIVQIAIKLLVYWGSRAELWDRVCGIGQEVSFISLALLLAASGAEGSTLRANMKKPEDVVGVLLLLLVFFAGSAWSTWCYERYRRIGLPKVSSGEGDSEEDISNWAGPFWRSRTWKYAVLLAGVIPALVMLLMSVALAMPNPETSGGR